MPLHGLYGRGDQKLFESEAAEDHPVALMIVGCLGTGEDDKHMQANLRAMNEQSPSVVVNLGDLGYTGFWAGIKNWLFRRPGFVDDGISDHHQLQAQLIGPADKTNLKNTIFFLTVGNHELNIHGGRFVKLALLACGFLLTAGPALAAYRRSVRQGRLNLDKLEGFVGVRDYHFRPEPLNPYVKLNNFSQERKFQMKANGYYKLRSKQKGADLGQFDLETIFLNTCTLPYDEDQIQWLIDAINECPATHLIIACHHPIEAPTVGKRRFKDIDGLMYAEAHAALGSAAEGDLVRWRYKQLVALSRGPGHGDILAYVWDKEVLPKLDPQKRALIRAIFVAHDHFTAVSIGDHGIPQFTVGGGGGDKLNKPKYAKLDPRCLYAKKETGVANVIVQEDGLLVSIFAGHPAIPKGINCTIPRCEVRLTESTADKPHGLELTYSGRTVPDEGVHHRIRYIPQANNGCAIERAERRVLTDPYKMMTHYVHNDQLQSQSLHMGLFIELQHELDKLAIYLQLATKTPAALAGSYNADMRFKQIFDLLSNCRVFMYRLGKFYAKSWGNGQQVEQVLRTIIFSIGSINRAAQGIQVKALVLDGAEMYEYKQQLKELNKHYGSSRLTVFDVLGCAVLFLITAVMIRFLFFAGDIDEQPKVAVTPTTALGYSVLTAVMVWLIQGVARWKIRPKVENNFGVRLREFVGETLGILEELTKPILEEVTYGTFPGNG